MIPIVMRGHLALSGASLAWVLMIGACTSPGEPGPDTPLLEGLGRYGHVVSHPGGEELQVVVIRDRHTVHGAITRSRDALFSVRRENRAALAFLLSKGFDLLGCEAPAGALPRTGVAQAHREAVQTALANGDTLDALTVYQPIRYEEELGSHLKVIGVEDEHLYQEDVERLEEIVRLRALRGRNDLDQATRQALGRKEEELVRQVASQTNPRGRLAAANLVRTMRQLKRNRAVLMLGGAHTPAAVEALVAEGAATTVFECRSYGRGSGE